MVFCTHPVADRTLYLAALPLELVRCILSLLHFHYCCTFIEMLASPRVADMVAMICMFRTYLVVENQPSEERLADLEKIARMAHSILAHCGTSPHLSNLFTLWECCSRTLRVFESELFPDDPVVTPGHIALPPEPKSLASLRNAEWILHRPEVREGYLALNSLRLFLVQHFDVELHIKAYQVIDDSKLLLQTVAALIDTNLDGI